MQVQQGLKLQMQECPRAAAHPACRQLYPQASSDSTAFVSCARPGFKCHSLSTEISLAFSLLFPSTSSPICDFPAFTSLDAPVPSRSEVASLKLKCLYFHTQVAIAC